MTVRKNIVLLSDGTGNAASRVWRTNIWRVFGRARVDVVRLSRR